MFDYTVNYFILSVTFIIIIFSQIQTESIGCQTGPSLNTSEMSEENGENSISTEFNPSLFSTTLQDQAGYGEEDTSCERYDFSSNDISTEFKPSLSRLPCKTRQDMVKVTRGVNGMTFLRMKN